MTLKKKEKDILLSTNLGCRNIINSKNVKRHQPAISAGFKQRKFISTKRKKSKIPVRAIPTVHLSQIIDLTDNDDGENSASTTSGTTMLLGAHPAHFNFDSMFDALAKNKKK